MVNEEKKEKLMKFADQVFLEIKKVFSNPMNQEDAFEEFKEDLVKTPMYKGRIMPKIRQIAGCDDPHDLGTYSDCGKEEKIIASDLVDLFWDRIEDKMEEIQNN